MELFKLFGTIAIQNADANEQIDDTTDRAKESGNFTGRLLAGDLPPFPLPQPACLHFLQPFFQFLFFR